MLLRVSGGVYVQGVWTPGSRESVSGIVATVSPASGKDLLFLPEAIRTRRTIRIVTASEIRTVDEFADPPIEPDVVVHDGQEFVVTYVGHSNNGVIPNYAALATRMPT
jgi:hypothetical protein